MSRPTAGVLLACAIGIAAALAHWSPAASVTMSEEDLVRQIKSDAFDEKWDAVMTDCETMIAAFPSSQSLPWATFYRAKALQHIPGREQDALDAYTAFVGKFPAETTLREDATLSRLGLARDLWLKGKRDTIAILMKGLEEKGYPGIYAAIQISQLDHKPAKSRALPVLKDCSANEKDQEVRNECTIAILRIDPSQVPDTKPAPVKPVPPGSTATSEPRLIRLEVRAKGSDKITVAVNLPIAFAEALLSSLSEFDQGQVAAELKKKHIDLDNIWKSLKGLGRQTLVQIETEEQNIRIWLE
jgi:hypothetical protein